MRKKLDKNTVIFDPIKYYPSPAAIVQDQTILTNREDKVAALMNWRYDIVQSRVAEEENMCPLSTVNSQEVKLEDKIIAALAELGEHPTANNSKFGSI